jgi:hypothetical protein
MEPDLLLRLGAFVVVEATAPRLVALSILGLLTSRDGGGLVDRDFIFSMLRLFLVCLGLARDVMAPSCGLSEPVGVVP